jgi:hypothetical protein
VQQIPSSALVDLLKDVWELRYQKKARSAGNRRLAA